jgi:tetratricopeptide (TPR) repeat protein
MERSTILVLLLAPALVSAADAPTPTAAARQRWLRGNIGEARQAYEALVKEPQHAIVAAIGLSRTWEDEGEYDKAAQVIDEALKSAADNPDLLARRAELYAVRGRLDDAIKTADKAIAKQDDQFLARWVRACAYRDTGELQKADAEYRWFVKTYTNRDGAGRPITDPDSLMLVAQAGAENARWHNLADQFRFILNEVYGDVLKADPDLWMAEVQAGMLLLEKHNKGEALAAFDKALKINPRAPQALIGKGLAALEKLELKDAEDFAKRALAVNPRLPAALQLAADMHLASGEFAEAARRLAETQAVNPRDETTLGKLAACQFLLKKKTELDALCAAAEKANPKAGRFYAELANCLDERRLFTEAEVYYKKALALWPQLPGAQTSLGMLALRMGKEDDARKILEGAFKSDPFNVRTSNSIKVLKHLDNYKSIQTPHYLLRYDEKTDAALAHYLSEYLEGLYEDLAKQFNYRPTGPILVEVFNNHDMFSGRIVALPDLHTIGACTGRMFAMVSPKGKGLRRPFNWGRVIRHEMVHIFNLEQTNFQVPHWLTEGLAVRNECFPRPPSWNQVLVERVNKDDLLNLTNVNLGFMRPRTPDEWTLAYCQSNLYIEYMTRTHGPESVAGMLAAYKDGLETEAAIKKVCGVEVADFEAGYKAYVREIAGTLRGGKPPEKAMTLAQLQAAVEKAPEDMDLAARLAEQYWRRKRNADARKLVNKVLAKEPGHGLALFLDAQLLLAGGENEKAQAKLEAAAQVEPPEPRVLKALGKLYYDAGQFDKAAEVYERGRRAEPIETSWLEDLARVYKQTNDTEKRIAVLSDLAPTDPDELDIRRGLAEMLAEAKRWPEAERWAREALEIDVQNETAREVYLKSLTEQGKNAELERAKKMLGEK